MPIITFCSNETKETGQTMSVATIATYMAIEHNYKILVVPTSFNDISLENCFWEYSKIRASGAIKQDGTKSVGLESGIEGLIKVLNSNRTSNEIVKNYSRTVLRDRLDVLPSAVTKDYKEYAQITSYYSSILTLANRYYDLVLVDLDKKVPAQDAQAIITQSDVIMINLNQRLKAINDFMALREKNEFYQKKNVMLLLGRYDSFSKYNNKNVTRYLKEKKLISAIPYNTLLFEAACEGTIIDFILRVKNITDDADRNVNFVKEVKEASNNILFKLDELQMKF